MLKQGESSKQLFSAFIINEKDKKSDVTALSLKESVWAIKSQLRHRKIFLPTEPTDLKKNKDMKK